MNKCLICGGSEFTCIHKGTRDDPSISVMKCMHCGFVQLDSQRKAVEAYYAAGNMLKGEYYAEEDAILDINWEEWTRETARDDERRYRALLDICGGGDVLDFGCGNGGFLKRIRGVAASVTGIELMDEARKRLNEDGIPAYASLAEASEAGLQQFDIICMFHVIEHLHRPDEVLKDIFNHLAPGGLLICETCNADDALLSKYMCEAYADFTYWSEHVFLFNSDTLEKLITRNGFCTLSNQQIQRYTLANHLYWLANGKPGGHTKWLEFNHEELNCLYAGILADQKIGDTLWYIGRKGEE